MESLFKFVLERPPVQQDEDLIIELTQNSKLPGIVGQFYR